MFYFSIPWGNAHSGPWLDPTCWLDYLTLHDSGAKSGAANPQKPLMLHNSGNVFFLSVFHIFLVCAVAVFFSSAAVNGCISGICRSGDKYTLCILTVSVFFLLFFTFSDLLVSPPFVMHLSAFAFYCGPRRRGERGMFAYSLTRRVWHLTEQICFNVNHTGGNYGLFAGRCRAEMRFWPRVLRPYEPPLFTTVTLLSHVQTQGGDRRVRGAYCSLFLLFRVE